MANVWNLVEDEFVSSDTTVSMLTFNVSNTSETGIEIYYIMVNNTGNASAGNFSNITVSNGTWVEYNESFEFPVNISINKNITFEQNFTINFTTNTTITDGATFQANVTEIGNETNVSYAGIGTINSSTVTLDGTAPNVSAINDPAANANLSGTSQILNATVTDSPAGVDTVQFNVSNSTYSTMLDSTEDGDNYNATLNTTSLVDGSYNITVVANDTVNNINNTEYITITIDNQDPSLSLSKASSTRTSITVSKSCSFGPSGEESCSISSSSESVSGNEVTGLSCGSSYYITLTGKSNSGMEASTTSSMSTNNCAGGGGTPPYWTSTYIVNDEQFEEGFTRERGVKERFEVSIGGETHHVGVVELTVSTATINVSSTPQQKTLSVGEEWKVDVTEDDYYDVLVTLNEIEGDSAEITLQSIREEVVDEEEVIEEDPLEEEPTPEEEERSLVWLWILIAVVIVAAAAWNYKSGKERKK